mmetsp:Transcript_10139/g.18455  ORF Transcript_10139/g.18455 Transcript_10139/m.18455 type:complete len:216 (-) Transcript_10139:1788-2435(-)
MNLTARPLAALLGMPFGSEKSLFSSSSIRWDFCLWSVSNISRSTLSFPVIKNHKNALFGSFLLLMNAFLPAVSIMSLSVSTSRTQYTTPVASSQFQPKPWICLTWRSSTLCSAECSARQKCLPSSRRTCRFHSSFPATLLRLFFSSPTFALISFKVCFSFPSPPSCSVRMCIADINLIPKWSRDPPLPITFTMAPVTWTSCSHCEADNSRGLLAT